MVKNFIVIFQDIKDNLSFVGVVKVHDVYNRKVEGFEDRLIFTDTENGKANIRLEAKGCRENGYENGKKKVLISCENGDGNGDVRTGTVRQKEIFYL